MPAATTLIARRRLEWHAWLDLPVGLRPVPTESEPALGILLGHPGLRNPGPYADGTQPGWLVLIGISNPGWASVHGTDFAAPLAFTFPGRQVLSARISPGHATRKAIRASRDPTIQVPPEASQGASPGSAAPRVQFLGDFELRPKDGYMVTVLLRGTPAAQSLPIRQDGILTNGKITTCPQPRQPHEAVPRRTEG